MKHKVMKNIFSVSAEVCHEWKGSRLILISPQSLPPGDSDGSERVKNKYVESRGGDSAEKKWAQDLLKERKIGCIVVQVIIMQIEKGW